MSAPKMPTLYATFFDMRTVRLSDPLHRVEVVSPEMLIGFAGATTHLAGIAPFGGDITIEKYVPASALEEANEALRVANEENKRLRDLIANFDPRTDYYASDLKIAALSPKESADE